VDLSSQTQRVTSIDFVIVVMNVAAISCLMPNTYRRRRRDETVELRRVGVGGVYMNSQLLTTPADGFGDVNAAVGRNRVYNSAVNAIEVSIG